MRSFDYRNYFDLNDFKYVKIYYVAVVIADADL
jgi:hypothetical protein